MLAQVDKALQEPEMIIGVWQAGMALRERQEMDEPTVLVAMRQMSQVWEHLFPIEQNRIVRLLIERVQLHEDGLDIIWCDDSWLYWQKIIDTGEMANASELARRFKLESGWVSEVLRMTRLAPDIIRAILEGRQPRHLNLHTMRGRQAEVPLDWDAQRRLFEFIAPKG